MKCAKMLRFLIYLLFDAAAKEKKTVHCYVPGPYKIHVIPESKPMYFMSSTHASTVRKLSFEY